MAIDIFELGMVFFLFYVYLMKADAHLLRDKSLILIELYKKELFLEQVASFPRNLQNIWTLQLNEHWFYDVKIILNE